MILGAVKETQEWENRVPVTPETAKKFVSLGFEVCLEKGIGSTLSISDEVYTAAGCTMLERSEIISKADVMAGVRKPSQDKIDGMREGTLHVSFLDPFNEKELIAKLCEKKINSISMEFIPRITRAQKMDALSSQANLGGYVAVLIASSEMNKAMPMMMTAAGTISPAKVFIIGVGVAGLQAIATAKRLGARVEAFDTRAVVEEQVNSLGAKFVKIDVGETGQTKDGYAKPLTPEQIELQRQGMKKVLSRSDIVITTAQVFGRKAPVLLTKDMVEAMMPGSVIVDMAVETGGNVELSELGKTVVHNGVKIIGKANLPGEVVADASQVYSNNIFNLLGDYWDKETKTLKMPPDEEIIAGCFITRDGQIVNSKLL